MPAPAPCILTVNGGSSSIKFATFTRDAQPRRLLTGQIERISSSNTTLTAKDNDGRQLASNRLDARDHRRAAQELIEWLGERRFTAVGHRVVHGGLRLIDHQLVTPELVEELKATQPLDLAHLPREIALIETIADRLPGVPQVACFDTAFHRDLPRVAQLLPIPRKYLDRGIRRLGFHGLSYTYLMDELRRTAGDAAADGRVILAHLGSGASLAAVRHGKPIDTTMAFTPTAGIVMGTRPGDLDPGLLVYLARVEHCTPDQLDDLISHECGLAGVSGGTSDVRDLLARRATDRNAADAIDLFCYSVRKAIGSFAAVMGGLDTLVFSGGIGEHSVPIRAQICEGLEYLGVTIDERRNGDSEPNISAEGSRTTVRVIPTDEEIVIARTVVRLLAST
jgi:acetate kinase